jgi:hypothetical protein
MKCSIFMQNLKFEQNLKQLIKLLFTDIED